MHAVFETTGALMRLLEKVLKVNLHVEGMENVVENPTLFVVNHFTRAETFLIPYVLHKHKQMHARSLAHESLFQGLFGSYLRSMGTLPMHEPLRNQTIIGDLLTGRANWVIYPEGVMVKNKKIFQHGRFMVDAPTWKGPPHTGAAVLALMTETVKHDIAAAREAGNADVMLHYRTTYDFADVDDVSKLNTVITPVNITYYPLRPGKNLLSDIVGLLAKRLPARLDEELKTEGKILFSDTDVSIYFAPPIDVALEVGPTLALSEKYHAFTRFLPKNTLTVALRKKQLTRRFMREIYTKTQIHIDHLFCMGLRALKVETIKEEDFRRALYLSAVEIGKMEKKRTHPTLRKNILSVIADECYHPYESICRLAEKEGVLVKKAGALHLNKAALNPIDIPFHDVRLKNVTGVVANELEPLRDVVGVIQRNVNLSGKTLRSRVVEVLSDGDIGRFEDDYAAYCDKDLSKPPSVGRPFFLKSHDRSIGVVLSHGYLAAPAEIRPMAEYLFEKGYSVYGPCLPGMGTAPRQLADVSWEDWVQCYDRAYAAVRNYCDNVFVGGFSAGGLLALLAAARRPHAVKGVFCINSPLALKDVRSHLAPLGLTWNELLDRFHISGGKFEFVDHHTENPQINYTVNYLKGLNELAHLMSQCRKMLTRVIAPALVIQGKNDPAIDPKSATIISSSIRSDKREIVNLESDGHVIVLKEGREKVFEIAHRFISDTMSLCS